MLAKPWYQSKTFYVNLIIALSPIVPGAEKFFSENPDSIMIGIAVINIILRLFTRKPLELTKS